MQFIPFSGMLNQLQKLILRGSILLWVPMVLSLSSYTMMMQFLGVGLTLGLLLCIMAFWYLHKVA